DQPLYIVGATYEPIDDSLDYMERVISFQHYFDKQQIELLQRVEVLDEDTQELSGYNMHYAVQCLVSEVDIEELLGLMGLFLPNRLCLDARVYIIEPQSRIVYHIYDDRGMDLVSPDREALRPLYHQFSDWILDYDR
ncbi:DUF3885 domain-containing protein, partial [Paenibacillus sp. 598K]|uniref:DUF3885 domain-containing protein n=1 Tax=Paenibacillus sp. 598K TaxID=1117987 RepID=UPI0016249D47